MPRTAQETHGFLDGLRDHEAMAGTRDATYDRLMYRAHLPVGPDTLEDIMRFLAATGDMARHPIPNDPAVHAEIDRIVRHAQYPDPTALARLAPLLPDWDAHALSVLVHTAIADYAIYGPAECAALRALGRDATYTADPRDAHVHYAQYQREIKRLRDAATYDHVPESHHYLTRIIQHALARLGKAT